MMSRNLADSDARQPRSISNRRAGGRVHIEEQRKSRYVTRVEAKRRAALLVKERRLRLASVSAVARSAIRQKMSRQGTMAATVKRQQRYAQFYDKIVTVPIHVAGRSELRPFFEANADLNTGLEVRIARSRATRETAVRRSIATAYAHTVSSYSEFSQAKVPGKALEYTSGNETTAPSSTASRTNKTCVITSMKRLVLGVQTHGTDIVALLPLGPVFLAGMAKPLIPSDWVTVAHANLDEDYFPTPHPGGIYYRNIRRTPRCEYPGGETHEAEINPLIKTPRVTIFHDDSRPYLIRDCVPDANFPLKADCGAPTNMFRKARIRRLLLATRGLNRRVDQLSVRAALHCTSKSSQSETTGPPDESIISKVHIKSSDNHTFRPRIINTPDISANNTANYRNRDIHDDHVRVISSPQVNAEMINSNSDEAPPCHIIENSKTAEYDRKISNIIPPMAASFATRGLPSGSLSIINRIAKELGETEDIIPKSEIMAPTEADLPPNKAFHFPSLFIIGNDISVATLPHLKASLQLSPISANRTNSLKAPAAHARLLPLSLYFQLVSEIQWQDAIAESSLELVKFETQRTVVQAQEEAAITIASRASKSEVRWQRVELARQRATYEAALCEALVEHSSVAADGRSFPFKLQTQLAYGNSSTTCSTSDSSGQNIAAQLMRLRIDNTANCGSIASPLASPSKLRLDQASHMARSRKGSLIRASPQIENSPPKSDTKTMVSQPVNESMLLTSVTVLLAGLRTDLNAHKQQCTTPPFFKEALIMQGINSVAILNLEKNAAFVTGLRIGTPESHLNQVEHSASIDRAAITVDGEVDRSPPNSEPVIYCVGDRVEAQYGRGRVWFFGRVTRLHLDICAYDVEYDDGDVDVALPDRFIRSPLAAVLKNISQLDACMPTCEAQFVGCRLKGAHICDTNCSSTSNARSFLLSPTRESASPSAVEEAYTKSSKGAEDSSSLESLAKTGPDSDSNDGFSASSPKMPFEIALADAIFKGETWEEESTRHSRECSGKYPDSRVQLPYSKIMPLDLTCANDNELYSDEASGDNSAEFHRSSCVRDKKQSRLNANVNAVDRRLALKTLEEELQRELNMTEACIESAKKHLDEIRSTEAIITDKISAPKIPKAGNFMPKTVLCNAEPFLKRFIESSAYDHVELAEQISISDKLTLVKRHRDNNSVDLRSASKDTDVCGHIANLSIDNMPAFETHSFASSVDNSIEFDFLVQTKQWQQNGYKLAIAIQPIFRGWLMRKLCTYTEALKNTNLIALGEGNTRLSGLMYNHMELVEPTSMRVITLAHGIDHIPDETMSQNPFEIASVVCYDYIEVAELPTASHLNVFFSEPATLIDKMGLDHSSAALAMPLARYDLPSSSPFPPVCEAGTVTPSVSQVESLLTGYDVVEGVELATPNILLEPGSICAPRPEKMAGWLLQRLIRESIVAVGYFTQKVVPNDHALDDFIFFHTPAAAPLLEEPVPTQSSEPPGSPTNAEPATYFLEQSPRDWSNAVAAYAVWLASDGEALLHSLDVAATNCTSENNASALLELFIDTEQRCDAAAIKFSFKPSEKSDLPLTGGTREQAQIHRHAVFDALAELIIDTYKNVGSAVATLLNWFKQPGEGRRPTLSSQKTLVNAATMILNSQTDSKHAFVFNYACVRGLELERDICIRFANIILRSQLQAVVQATNPFLHSS